MSCNDYQLQMSLCLDGRLPAGTRAAVLAHVTACEDCARVWNDLQKAQELVLNLPVQRTSRDFRSTLWQRIESGEGSPEITFDQPLPLLVKARYVLTGAAAAALLLFGGRLLLGPSDTEPKLPNQQEVAKAPAPGARGGAPMQPMAAGAAREAGAVKDEVVEFTPRMLAEAFAQRTARSVRSLRTRLCSDSPRVTAGDPEVRREVVDLQRSAMILRWLREDNLLLAAPDVEDDLRLIMRWTQTCDTHALQATVCEVGQLEKLPRSVGTPAAFDQRDFMQKFKGRLERDPAMSQMMRLEIAPAGVGSQSYVVIFGR